MADTQTPRSSTEKDMPIAATVARLRERHEQGLARIPSYLWADIPALLDAAEDGIRLRAGVETLADYFASLCHHDGDQPHTCGTLIAAHDVARIIREGRGTSLVEHRQVHRPATGDSKCTCGGWVGPMTTIPATDPRSFAAHLTAVTSPEETADEASMPRRVCRRCGKNIGPYHEEGVSLSCVTPTVSGDTDG